jgi:DNA-directed RNA polymerase subunit H (RpoH/RPB5)
MKKKVILIVVFSLVIIGMGYAIYRLNKDVEDKKKKITDLEKASKNSNVKYDKLMYTKDSLMLINAFLAKYRTLTVAMTYRDSVRMSLKYKIGDVVRMKRDSARAIISDIIIGGGRYEYYIKYKVMLKSGQEEDIVQEMLY